MIGFLIFINSVHRPARDQGRNTQVERIALADARACAFEEKGFSEDAKRQMKKENNKNFTAQFRLNSISDVFTSRLFALCMWSRSPESGV